MCPPHTHTRSEHAPNIKPAFFFHVTPYRLCCSFPGESGAFRVLLPDPAAKGTPDERVPERHGAVHAPDAAVGVALGPHTQQPVHWNSSAEAIQPLCEPR